MQKFTTFILILSSLSIATSFPIAYLAYFGVRSSAFTYYEMLASFMFWTPVISLALIYPLRSSIVLFARYIRAVGGRYLFVSYVTVHVILYGLLLEAILHYAYRLPEMVTRSSVHFDSAFYPASPWAIIASFGFYPNISILVPPAFDFVWSFYSVALAMIIGALVVTNVMQVRELGKICTPDQKTRALFLLPIIGVALGATCCLSFPLLVSLAAAFAVIIPNSLAAFLTAYFVLPCTSVILLKYNIESTSKMVTDIQRLERSLYIVTKSRRYP